MKIETSTTNHTILDSGSIIVPEEEYVEFQIESLRFRFIFVNDDALQCEKKSTITGELREDNDGKFFNITVYNYTDLFATPTHMMNVAHINGKQLSVRFSIVELSSNEPQSMRIFHYTWYQSK